MSNEIAKESALQFNQFFSMQDLERINTFYHQKKNPKDEYSAPVDEFYVELKKFYTAVVGFLKAQHEQNPLPDIKFSDGHETLIQESWKRLRDSSENSALHQSQESYHTESIGKLFLYPLFGLLREINVSSVQEVYGKLNTMMSTGNFDCFELGHEDSCAICSTRVKIGFQKWHPHLTAFDLKKGKFVTPESCMERKVVELDIEFKTGLLLVADWFRIAEFTSAVDYNKDYKDVSINYAKGRVNSTTQRVEKFNFITVHVGNTSPEILCDGANIIVGHLNEEMDIEPSNFQAQGSVCTDLWNVTIIEKEQLIHIIAQSTGLEVAREKVEQYLQENDVKSLTIAPGNYKLRFHPDYELFAEVEEDSEIPKDIEPFFTLKKDVPQLKMKKKM